MLERDGKVTLSASQKYILIRQVIEKYNLINMVKFLCEAAGVSRSGYYNYFSAKSVEQRKRQEKKDEEAEALILKTFHFKGRKKGARQNKMTLADKFQCVSNFKKIRRLMKKFVII